MFPRLRLCVAQMTSTNRHAGNIAFVEAAARHAAGHDCDLLALPEVAGLMNRNAEEARRQITAADKDPFIAACTRLAGDHGLWLQTGSTPVSGPDGRFLNHGDLIDDEGRIRASYDKMHLFDASLDGQKLIGESKRFAPGDRAVLVQTPWGPWGLSICYDLRFPQLYRDYALRGATLLFIPSAFTIPTGRAHWEVLLRARAIETGAYVVAAAQVGRHEDGRSTWGHSLVVDPWGEVLTDMGGEKPGLAVVDLDLGKVAKARAQIPSLQNGRDYTMREV